MICLIAFAALLSGRPACAQTTPVTLNDTSTSITYSGSGWGYYSARGIGDFQDDVHATYANGASVSYTFTGTGISYITEMASDEGNVQVYLDGTLQATVNCNSATRKVQQTVWSIAGLGSGSHVLKLVKQDGGYMVLDALQVQTASTPTYLSNLTLDKTAVTGGNGLTGTVTLSSTSSTATTVTLSSNNSAVVVPINVVIPSGVSTKTFPVTTSAVSEVIYPTLIAKSNGWTQAVVATVLPASQSFTIQNLTVEGGNQCVVLNWSDLPAGAIRGYKIYRRLNSGTATLLTPTPQQASTYADMGLTSGTPYSYQVSVVDVNGQELTPSSWITATPNSSSVLLNFVNAPSSGTGSVQGTLRLTATMSSGANSQSYNLLIDGADYGEAGQEASGDGSSVQGTISAVTIDTTTLTNGTHILQMISEPGDSATATPLLSLQVNNPISHDLVTSLLNQGAGEAVNIDAGAPATSSQWQVTIAKESDNTIIQSWQGLGTTIHLAWDGTDASGNPVTDQYYTVNVTILPLIPSSGTTSPNAVGISLHRTVTTPFDGLRGLALIDRIDLDATHTDALAANVKAAFAQMKITDGNFRGTVLLPPEGQPKQAKYAVYRKIRNWLKDSVTDFYVYGHGRRQEAANSSKPQLTTWGGLVLYPLLPTDPSEQVAVTNSVRFIIVPQLFRLGASRQGYNFVFIDSCYSAGGPNGTEMNSPSGEPRLLQWQQAFSVPYEDSTGGTSFGVPCFVGWNGLIYTNTFYNGKMTNFMRWRQYFWTNLAVNGTTVESAASKATSATINEINRGVTQSGSLRPWDTNGPYSRSVRIDSSLTLLP